MDRPAIGSWDMLAADVVISGAAIASWEPECVRIRSRDDYGGKESQSTAALGTGRSGAAAAFSGHPTRPCPLVALAGGMAAGRAVNGGIGHRALALSRACVPAHGVMRPPAPKAARCASRC